MIARLALLGLLYCWLLGPRFVFADVMWLTVGLFALASPLSTAHRTVTKWPMNLLWLTAALLAAYSVGISLAHQSMDFGYAVSWVKAALFAYSAATLVLLYRHVHGDASLETLSRDIVIAAAISAVISLVIFVTAPIREIVGSMIIGTVANTLNGQIGLRAYDLSIGGGTAYGLFNVLVMVVLYHHKRLFSPSTRILLFTLLTAVNFVSARSAFAITVGLTLIAWMFNLAPRHWAPVVGRTLVIAAATAGIALGAMKTGVLPSMADSEKLDDFFEITLPWAFELFLSANKGDGAGSATTDQIANELFFPDAIYEMMLGVGDSEPLSDSGLVRTVFAVGMFGLLVHLALVVGFWSAALARIPGATERRILSICAALLLLFNFKELVFSNNRGLFSLFVLLYYAFMLLRPANPSTGSRRP